MRKVSIHTARQSIPRVLLLSRSYSPAYRRMIIYVVDPIKQTTEPKGRASGTASERETGDTGEEGDRIEDKNQVSVDRVLRATRLGAPAGSAAYRVSARR